MIDDDDADDVDDDDDDDGDGDSDGDEQGRGIRQNNPNSPVCSKDSCLGAPYLKSV